MKKKKMKYKLIVIDSESKKRTILDLISKDFPVGAIPSIDGPIFPKTTLGMKALLNYTNKTIIYDTEGTLSKNSINKSYKNISENPK